MEPKDKDPQAAANEEMDRVRRNAEMVDRAREALGLRTNEVMASSVKEGVVTIVTIGAHKATWRPGQRVKPLHPLHAGRSILPTPPPAAPSE